MAKKNEPAALLQHYKEFKSLCTAYFTRIGHPEKDMKQLWKAIQDVKLTLTDKKTGKEERTTIDNAIEVLGEETFLSGISRCAFHASAYREDAKGKYSVYFDLHEWWK